MSKHYERISRSTHSIQAGIISCNGRSNSFLLFGRFPDENVDGRMLFLKSIASNVSSHQDQKLTSGLLRNFHEYAKKEDLDGKRPPLLLSQKTSTNLFLSYHGYKKLGVKQDLIPDDFYFQKGMNSSYGNGLHGNYNQDQYLDRRLLPLNRKRQWDFLICIHNDNIHKLKKEKSNIKNLFDSVFPTKKDNDLFVQKTYITRDKNTNLPLSPLGFVDGISSLKPSDKENFEKIIDWSLIHEKDPNLFYGSYVVVQKISVNKSFFKSMAVKISKDLKTTQKHAKALMMGRYQDGQPLVETKDQNTKLPSNDFDFINDPKGNLCPFNAHIRAMNNRDKEGSEVPIIRRSLLYNDPPGANREADSGMIFISFQRNIEKTWKEISLRMGIAPNLFENVDNERSVDHINYRTKINLKLPAHFDLPADENKSFRWSNFRHQKNGKWSNYYSPIGGTNLTQFRGGEYFFAPSLTFFQNMERYIENAN
ncbi:MAG: hypothetical protein AAGF87_14095 [Bacteroidota bacterium]